MSSGGFLMAAVLAVFGENAFAQSEADNPTKSNPPFNLAPSLRVQNFFAPKYEWRDLMQPAGCLAK
jgi:hypothetical protein